MALGFQPIKIDAPGTPQSIQLRMPKIPISCMFCDKICGVQGLSTHIKNHHPQENNALDFHKRYNEYIELAKKLRKAVVKSKE